MQHWQFLLLLLGGLWASQSVATWMQMRHYQKVLRAVTAQWHDGFVGTGYARGGLRKGAIVVVVVSPDDIVRRLLLMEGRSVLAKFIALAEFEGLPLASLDNSAVFSARKKARKQALAAALKQIERARAAQRPQGEVAAQLVHA